MDFEAIRKAQLLERQSASLSALDPGFYAACVEFFSRQADELDRNYSKESERALENAKDVLRELAEKRVQKILMKCSRDAKEGESDAGGLGEEERKLYLQVMTDLKVFQESVTPSGKPKRRKLRVLNDLPEFAGSDLKPHGPFKKGELIELGEKDARLLLKRKAVEEV
jgi:DNA replication initiation complex subunit (GINS family)